MRASSVGLVKKLRVTRSYKPLFEHLCKNFRKTDSFRVVWFVSCFYIKVYGTLAGFGV